MNTEYVENILSAWEQTTDAHRESGRAWYPQAHKLAAEIGKGDAKIGAGIIAALSPQKAWDINVKLARRVSDGDFSGHVTDALDKCRAIMAGENPAKVLPWGKKTWHFFHNLWLPDDELFVTVDRHAWRVATCGWDVGSPVIKPPAYREIAEAYRVAADEICEIPNDLQAATWEWARERV